jgi:diguanylate cyclase (GGDEF)-like protein
VQPDFSPTRANASERGFVLYFSLIGSLAVLTLIREVLDRVGFLSGELELFSSTSEIALDFLLVMVVCAASPQFLREMKRRRTTALQAQQSRTQIELLFNMADTLQSALGHADANSVLRSTASSLLPGFGGALYIFNNSGDRLELSTSWRWPEVVTASESISPSDCWAIKRGKWHLNLVDDGAALCCEHHQGGLTTLEIPMMARGEVYGLLIIQRDGAAATGELEAIAGVANALADAMSLSLSNLALRERLRTQALRDPLTGLYNRRYMEDALERYADQAARTHSPLSIVMIDLDHFKRLNDEHGHSMGDAVLSEVASAILGAIRPCDIACRYGGEELVVLFPDCGLEDGAMKAEVLRGRIERLSDRHGISISASFGVAAIADGSRVGEALSDADRALYRAKQEGRNRVVTATSQIAELRAAPSSSRAA